MSAIIPKHIDRAADCYISSYEAWYKFVGLPFGEKQKRTYNDNYLLIRQEARGHWTRYRAAEEIWKFKNKGEN